MGLNEMLYAEKKLRELGVTPHFIPLAPMTKNQPVGKWKDTTFDSLDSLFRAYPNTTSIGLLTGSKSGITVIDFDIKTTSKKDKDGIEKVVNLNGAESLNEAINKLNITDEKADEIKTQILNAFRVKSTNGKGFHAYWLFESGLPGDDNVLGEDTGVDIRNEGNYVVFPGSRILNEDGEPKEYELIQTNNMEINPIPFEIVPLLRKKKDKPPKTTLSRVTGSLIIDKMNECASRVGANKDILIEEMSLRGMKPVSNTHYNCTLCGSKDNMAIYQNGETWLAHCFTSGGECFHGDVVSLIMKLDGIKKNKALDYLQEKYDIGWEGVAGFPYTNDKGEPLKVWENLDFLLSNSGIFVVRNNLTYTLEVKGVVSNTEDGQIQDIHTLCTINGLNLNENKIGAMLVRIAEKYSYNPVADYLEKCKEDYPGATGELDKLFSTLTIEEDFPKDFAWKLLVKFLLNAVHVSTNDGNRHAEGVLVLQGGQGIGKSTWVKSIFPGEFFKAESMVKPSDKDSVSQNVSYWCSELAELDSTMKNDQSELKSFITRPIDTYRIPYDKRPTDKPRMTVFFGTVNDRDFLKDPTGSRRWWIIPIIDINWELLKEVNRDKLWAEIINLYDEGTISLNLSKEEYWVLTDLNLNFTVDGEMYAKLASGFAWDVDKEYWKFIPSTEIQRHFGFKTNKGMEEAFRRLGVESTREYVVQGNKKARPRGYVVPQFIYNE